ncbi:MAG: Gfo/Idh/MocA family oxidoreductase [Caldilineaceae bacterium]|nr:Gfo/Idh/MocA family oxidoreductase [Caldilineaceae bacterium]
MRKVRFAQAGMALMHAKGFRETLILLQDEIELVGFYDPDPDSVRPTLPPEVQAVPFYSSLTELLAEAKPEAMLISTYIKDLPARMLEVAEAGVHLWGEKPFATHSSQLAPLAAAMQRNQLHFSCGYSWRFHPISQLIKESYDAGLFGKPYAIEIRYITSSLKQRDPIPWHLQREQIGGGMLNWLGCHWFDLMRYLTSSEVTQVSAIEATLGDHSYDIEDAAAVSLQFANGMLGSLHTGYYTPGDSELTVNLYGSMGWAKWDHTNKSCTIKSTHPAWASAPLRTFEIPTAQYPGYGAEGRALIKAFAAAIRGEGQSGFTVDDAIKSLQIIEAAHESAAKGQAVHL